MPIYVFNYLLSKESYYNGKQKLCYKNNPVKKATVKNRPD